MAPYEGIFSEEDDKVQESHTQTPAPACLQINHNKKSWVNDLNFWFN